MYGWLSSPWWIQYYKIHWQEFSMSLNPHTKKTQSSTKRTRRKSLISIHKSKNPKEIIREIEYKFSYAVSFFFVFCLHSHRMQMYAVCAIYLLSLENLSKKYSANTARDKKKNHYNLLLYSLWWLWRVKRKKRHFNYKVNDDIFYREKIPIVVVVVVVRNHLASSRAHPQIKSK